MDVEDEPSFLYVPESDVTSRLRKVNLGDKFTQSLLMLNDGLSSGSLVMQYETLYRKNSDLEITEARKVDNLYKNRYRDISPCKYSFFTLLHSNSPFSIFKVGPRGDQHSRVEVHDFLSFSSSQ